MFILSHIVGCGALPVIVAQNKCDMPIHADVPGHDAMIQWATANGKRACVASHWQRHVTFTQESLAL
jgi:hypothetical protein